MDAILAPGFLDSVQACGDDLVKGLTALSARRSLGEVRGRGLLLALDLKRDIASKVVELARDAGLLLNAPRPNLLRFMPALNLKREETDAMLSTLENVLEQA
jgi:acetylornithine/N-succinyldiaminopimelate aminotransferase